MAGEDWLYEPRPRIPNPPTTKQVRFRDLNPDYMMDQHDLVITENLAIQAQIRNVLSTIIGSEDFESRYGSNLPLRLFDPISDVTAFLLEGDTIIALNKWMGSVIAISAAVRIDPLETEEGYRIVIPYVIRSVNVASIYAFEALR